jgi:DNA-binding XRE family transcriptional regulator
LIRVNAKAAPGSDLAAKRASRETGLRERASAGRRGIAFAGQALPLSESEILAQLGNRVRAMRRLRDMSRRELANRAGISARYIAQIEAGKGNVSIVLLLRIAYAVRCP